MPGRAVDDDARAVCGGQERVELAGEGEVPEVVGGELAFPAGPDPPLGGGHDSGNAHQEIERVEPVAEVRAG